MPQATAKYKGLPYKIALSLISTALVFGFLETVCVIVYSLTNGRKCPSLKNSTYPRHSERYLKLAIVGGSAAAGYNAERSFADFIQYELKKNLSTPIYVKNFAVPGYPFHRYEAEVIKNVIGDYDLFIIYEGNNEAYNFLDDSGYFRSDSNKNIRELKPLPDSQKDSTLHPIQFLINNSHSVNWFHRRMRKSLEFLTSRDPNFYNFDRNFKEFELKGILPRPEINKMKDNFREDLEEIGRLAKSQGMQVILSSVPTNEEYKPFFSYFRSDITQQEIENFHRFYSRGLSNFQNGRYQEALDDFLLA